MSTRALISVKEAARRLCMTPWSVYQLCESGAIPAGRVEGRIVIRPEDIEEYAKRVVREAPAFPVR